MIGPNPSVFIPVNLIANDELNIVVPIPVIIPDAFSKIRFVPLAISSTIGDLGARTLGGLVFVYPEPGFVILLELTDPFVMVAVAVAIVPNPIAVSYTHLTLPTKA